MYYMLTDRRNVKGKMSGQFVNMFYHENKEEAERDLANKCRVVGVDNDGSCFKVVTIYPAVPAPLTQEIKDYYNRPAHSKMEYPG